MTTVESLKTMVVKRINGRRRILQKLEFDPYKPMPESWKDNGTKVVRGVIPRASLKAFGLSQCCVCGLYEKAVVENRSGFVCERDFINPAIFFENKVIYSSGLHKSLTENLEKWVK